MLSPDQQLRHTERIIGLVTLRWANAATGRTFTKCGVHADAGRIFCANCGAALQTPLPLIRPTLEDYSSPSRTTRPTRSTIVKSILVGFPLSVVFRHRARHNHSRSRDSRSLGLHRSGSPRRYSAGSIWHGHKESVGYQYKTCGLSRLRLFDAASAAAEISKAGAVGWRHVWEVWLRDG